MAWPHGAAFWTTAGGNLDVMNTVIHDNGNGSADDIIHVNGTNSRFRAFHSTLVGNPNVDDAVLRTSSGQPSIGLFNTVLYDSVALYKNDGAAGALVRSVCVLANNLSTLDDAPDSDLRDSLQSTNIAFVNAGNDDFRLQASSDAIDLCRADELTVRGYLEASLRDFDRAERPRINTPDPLQSWDAGAFEYQGGLASQVSDVWVDLDDGDFVNSLNSSMTYLVTLGNDGPETVNGTGFRITLDNRLQAPMAFLPFDAGWTCSAVGRIGECTYSRSLTSGSVAPQVAIQFTSPIAPAVVSSSADVLIGALVADPALDNNTDSESTSIATSSDLSTRFSDYPLSLQPGQTGTVDVELQNHGPDVSLAPRLRLFFPDTVQNVTVLTKPSTAWTCGTASNQGDGTQAITCAANQAGVSTYGFSFGFDVPTSQAAPSDWVMRSQVAQDTPEPTQTNLAEVSVPVESVVGGPVVFRDGFED